VLIAGILLGLVLGLWSGGKLSNLATIRLRWVGLLFAAVIVRFGTEILLNADVAIVDTLRVPLLATGFGLLLAGLWVNRSYPGLSLAFIGILLNALVIIRNGGYMPIWEPALTAAGFTADDVHSALHVVVSGDIGADFLLRLVIFGDLIPIPVPYLQNVASLGDLFLTIGLAFFLFASVVRVPTFVEHLQDQVASGQLTGLAGATRIPRPDGAPGVAPETGLAPSLQNTARLERPLVLGAQGAGLASPALAPLPAPRPWEIDERWDDEREAQREAQREAERQTGPLAAATGAATRVAAALSGDAGTGTSAFPPITVPRPSPEAVERVRQHPYVRLALNGSFGALWAGQIVSLFGDRIHQLTLAGVVYLSTGSAFAVSMIFVAAFVPNLVFSPLAGTLVDRWDHKEVLVVSDLLRAAAVLLIPIAAVTNILIVYPLVFLITSISIFFRPARVAILPRIVDRSDLLTANSALWVGETFADIIGYPIAALFVTALGAALPIAFWLDAATYVASAALLSTIVVRAVDRSSDEPAPEETHAPDTDPMAIATMDPGETADLLAAITPDHATAPSADALDEVDDGSRLGFFGELKAGYRFLRGEPTLFANTIQASVAQMTVGVLTGLMLPYTVAMFGKDQSLAAWAFIDTGIGAGNLIGGFVIGLIGSRFMKGRMIIAGYAIWGLLTVFLALTGNLGLAIGIGFGSGIANMIFLIPSQTLFQERTPARLMGRVVGFRFALVFGATTAATVVGGVLTDVVGPTPVIALFGLITTAAGLAGLLVRAIRDA